LVGPSGTNIQINSYHARESSAVNPEDRSSLVIVPIHNLFLLADFFSPAFRLVFIYPFLAVTFSWEIITFFRAEAEGICS
jgi:hypothetical protein